MLVLMPRDAAQNVADYFSSTSALQKELNSLKLQQISNAQAVQKTQLLQTENDHLRQLIDLKARTPSASVLAEILYDARDLYNRKIILNKGSQHGVTLSQPVIDEHGVVGQVTRVFPLTAEVTLLTDKNQASPVQIQRNGLRSVINGRGRSAFLDMRVTSNADVQTGDILVTSGIDGIYPAGLQVAKVAQIENKATNTFEVVLCAPLAGIDLHKQLLILLVDTDNLPPPESEEARAKKEKINRKVTRDSVKDAVKEPSVDAAKENAAPNGAPVTTAKPANPAEAAPVSVPATSVKEVR
jgi:rod shape-determining protein MreC